MACRVVLVLRHRTRRIHAVGLAAGCVVGVARHAVGCGRAQPLRHLRRGELAQAGGPIRTRDRSIQRPPCRARRHLAAGHHSPRAHIDELHRVHFDQPAQIRAALVAPVVVDQQRSGGLGAVQELACVVHPRGRDAADRALVGLPPLLGREQVPGHRRVQVRPVGTEGVAVGVLGDHPAVDVALARELTQARADLVGLARIDVRIRGGIHAGKLALDHQRLPVLAAEGRQADRVGVLLLGHQMACRVVLVLRHRTRGIHAVGLAAGCVVGVARHAVGCGRAQPLRHLRRGELAQAGDPIRTRDRSIQRPPCRARRHLAAGHHSPRAHIDELHRVHFDQPAQIRAALVAPVVVDQQRSGGLGAVQELACVVHPRGRDAADRALVGLPPLLGREQVPGHRRVQVRPVGTEGVAVGVLGDHPAVDVALARELTQARADLVGLARIDVRIRGGIHAGKLALDHQRLPVLAAEGRQADRVGVLLLGHQMACRVVLVLRHRTRGIHAVGLATGCVVGVARHAVGGVRAQPLANVFGTQGGADACKALDRADHIPGLSPRRHGCVGIDDGAGRHVDQLQRIDFHQTPQIAGPRIGTVVVEQQRGRRLGPGKELVVRGPNGDRGLARNRAFKRQPPHLRRDHPSLLRAIGKGPLDVAGLDRAIAVLGDHANVDAAHAAELTQLGTDLVGLARINADKDLVVEPGVLATQRNRRAVAGAGLRQPDRVGVLLLGHQMACRVVLVLRHRARGIHAVGLATGCVVGVARDLIPARRRLDAHQPIADQPIGLIQGLDSHLLGEVAHGGTQIAQPVVVVLCQAKGGVQRVPQAARFVVHIARVLPQRIDDASQVPLLVVAVARDKVHAIGVHHLRRLASQGVVAVARDHTVGIRAGEHAAVGVVAVSCAELQPGAVLRHTLDLTLDVELGDVRHPQRTGHQQLPMRIVIDRGGSEVQAFGVDPLFEHTVQRVVLIRGLLQHSACSAAHAGKGTAGTEARRSHAVALLGADIACGVVDRLGEHTHAIQLPDEQPTRVVEAQHLLVVAAVGWTHLGQGRAGALCERQLGCAGGQRALHLRHLACRRVVLALHQAAEGIQAAHDQTILVIEATQDLVLRAGTGHGLAQAGRSAPPDRGDAIGITARDQQATAGVVAELGDAALPRTAGGRHRLGQPPRAVVDRPLLAVAASRGGPDVREAQAAGLAAGVHQPRQVHLGGVVHRLQQLTGLVVDKLRQQAQRIDLGHLAARLVVEVPLARPGGALRHAQSAAGVVAVANCADNRRAFKDQVGDLRCRAIEGRVRIKRLRNDCRNTAKHHPIPDVVDGLAVIAHGECVTRCVVADTALVDTALVDMELTAWVAVHRPVQAPVAGIGAGVGVEPHHQVLVRLCRAEADAGSAGVAKPRSYRRAPFVGCAAALAGVVKIDRHAPFAKQIRTGTGLKTQIADLAARRVMRGGGIECLRRGRREAGQQLAILEVAHRRAVVRHRKQVTDRVGAYRRRIAVDRVAQAAVTVEVEPPGQAIRVVAHVRIGLETHHHVGVGLRRPEAHGGATGNALRRSDAGIPGRCGARLRDTVAIQTRPTGLPPRRSRAGIALDHRDQAPDPVVGTGADASIEHAGRHDATRVVITRRADLIQGVDAGQHPAQAVVGVLRDTVARIDGLEQLPGRAVNILRHRLRAIPHAVAGRIHRFVAGLGLQLASPVVGAVDAERLAQILCARPRLHVAFRGHAIKGPTGEVEPPSPILNGRTPEAKGAVSILGDTPLGTDREAKPNPAGVIDIPRSRRAWSGRPRCSNRLTDQLTLQVITPLNNLTRRVSLADDIALRIKFKGNSAVLGVHDARDVTSVVVGELRGADRSADGRAVHLEQLTGGVVPVRAGLSQRVSDHRLAIDRVVGQHTDAAQGIGDGLDPARIIVREAQRRAVGLDDRRNTLTAAVVGVLRGEYTAIVDDFVLWTEVHRDAAEAPSGIVAIANTGSLLIQISCGTAPAYRAYLRELPLLVVVIGRRLHRHV